MSVVYLDTHVAVVLHAGKAPKLGRNARREIERREILLSPMVYVELDYLYRKGKVRYSAEVICHQIQDTFHVRFCTHSFLDIALKTVEVGWTSDPFDKIIVAQALANDSSPLVTADERIRAHYPQSVW